MQKKRFVLLAIVLWILLFLLPMNVYAEVDVVEITDMLFDDDSDLHKILHSNRATVEFLSEGKYLDSDAFNMDSKPVKILEQEEVDGYLANIYFYQDGSFIVTMSILLNLDTEEIVKPTIAEINTSKKNETIKTNEHRNLPVPIPWEHDSTHTYEGTGNFTHTFLKVFSNDYVLWLQQDFYRGAGAGDITFNDRWADGYLLTPNFYQINSISSWRNQNDVTGSYTMRAYRQTPPVAWDEYLEQRYIAFSGETTIHCWYSRSEGWYAP